jgi:hypothetical protein
VHELNFFYETTVTIFGRTLFCGSKWKVAKLSIHKVKKLILHLYSAELHGPQIWSLFQNFSIHLFYINCVISIFASCKVFPKSCIFNFLWKTSWVHQYVLKVYGSNQKAFFSLKHSVLWDIMPSSPLKVNQRFGETYRLHLQGWRLSQARNHHEAGSKQRPSPSQMLVNFQWTTCHFVPKDRTLPNHCCENVKS